MTTISKIVYTWFAQVLWPIHSSYLNKMNDNILSLKSDATMNELFVRSVLQLFDKTIWVVTLTFTHLVDSSPSPRLFCPAFLVHSYSVFLVARNSVSSTIITEVWLFGYFSFDALCLAWKTDSIPRRLTLPILRQIYNLDQIYGRKDGENNVFAPHAFSLEQGHTRKFIEPAPTGNGMGWRDVLATRWETHQHWPCAGDLLLSMVMVYNWSQCLSLWLQYLRYSPVMQYEI